MFKNLNWKSIASIILSLLLLVLFYVLSLSLKGKLGTPSGHQTQTSNGYGWMNNPIDPISYSFLQKTKTIDNATVLEIGAGTGSVSFNALKNGASVWVNDLDERHLSHFSKAADGTSLKDYKLVPGDFAEGVTMPENYFDNILAVRVLHFLSPDRLEKAISKMFTSLKPGGSVFILATTPYSNDWSSFLPEYEKRKQYGYLFPGYITNFSHYNSGYKEIVPEEMHFLEPVVLRREFEKSGFIVTYTDFIKTTALPNDKSLVGLIAEKPKTSMTVQSQFSKGY